MRTPKARENIGRIWMDCRADVLVSTTQNTNKYESHTRTIYQSVRVCIRKEGQGRELFAGRNDTSRNGKSRARLDISHGSPNSTAKHASCRPKLRCNWGSKTCCHSDESTSRQCRRSTTGFENPRRALSFNKPNQKNHVQRSIYCNSVFTYMPPATQHGRATQIKAYYHSDAFPLGS